MPKQFEMNINYRSHNGILRLASSVIDLISHFFPESIDKLPREHGEVGGPRPIVFEGFDSKAFFFHEDENESSNIEFGASQVIIVRDDKTKEHLKEKIGEEFGLILTVFESKGMEFNDVFLYNFFADSFAHSNEKTSPTETNVPKVLVDSEGYSIPPSSDKPWETFSSTDGNDSDARSEDASSSLSAQEKMRVEIKQSTITEENEADAAALSSVVTALKLRHNLTTRGKRDQWRMTNSQSSDNIYGNYISPQRTNSVPINESNGSTRPLSEFSSNNVSHTKFVTEPEIKKYAHHDKSGIPSDSSITYPDYEYTKLLSYSLYFYEAQRSDSALTDGQDVKLDLTGGYYDAGDYLKFTLPLSWTITSLSWGAYEWFDGYQLANQTQYLQDMIRWGTDWLIKSHPDNNTLYIQIGLGDVDNNYWGPDTNIPLPRPSFNVNSSAHGTDVVAETAAAMASASMLFREKLNDTTYADILLSHAKSLYDFAVTAPLVKYQDSVSEAKDFYSSSGFGDELVWASLWLYRATKTQDYMNNAINYFDTYSLGGLNKVINWDDKTGACYVLLAKLTQESNQDSSRWTKESERYLDGVASASNGCKFTKGGLYFCDGDSDAASLNPALNAAFVSLLYSPLATSTSKSNKYNDFANSQINYLLGKNPSKIPYVIGVHPNSPQNPHHAGAHGGSNIGNLNDPPVTQHILYGCIAALDYNAPFQSLMAYQVINSKEDPYYVTLPPGRGVVKETSMTRAKV
ncbi:13533_t:CDS:10 [Entrophospora sp. SA101]|nr:13533_t:CDS:10 [Entrophospora sp. SA101]